MVSKFFFELPPKDELSWNKRDIPALRKSTYRGMNFFKSLACLQQWNELGHNPKGTSGEFKHWTILRKRVCFRPKMGEKKFPKYCFFPCSHFYVSFQMVPELKPLSLLTQSFPQTSHYSGEKLCTTHLTRDSANRQRRFVDLLNTNPLNAQQRDLASRFKLG